MHKTATAVLALLWVFVGDSARCDETPYVSPGIGISWNFSGGLVVAPKISLGYLRDGKFVNLTLGTASCTADGLYPLYFVEIQAGTISSALEFRKTRPFCGGGLGVAISRTRAGTTLAPRVTAFIGYVVFANVNVMFADTIRTDLGGELVCPIPLKKFEFGQVDR